jgi:two-component system response regulator (stage 0 sporulation protein F)
VAKSALVIEDEQVMRDFVRAVLEEDGYDVEVAEDGDAGIRAFRAHPCDLVVTDLLMPEKEGIETCAELMQMDAGVRIIAISGALHAATHFRVLKHMGVRAMLHKPFSATDLRAAVETALGEPS